MYMVDIVTMGILTEDMSLRREMFDVCQRLILKGEIPYPYPEWMQEWMDTFAITDTEVLLVVSTVFPQRILLSLLQQGGI